ncbi:hypothetical protein TanjilG_05575 [Lupinus angustifolius]|uniref:Late embryogenesis abundant protein LEA-2 subgroup domain-containing protein n=1 Tax=Lupinus angustifolius TaxID=3871 RepID=A0A4P1QSC1_LUPAN|nr:PREDICTED: NDR1/HIN1-like protein 12 [Lupinus angustifolius]OIV93872.1 hypothetical protein TanjilG_05575 [Lupinus angustifolius]
MEEVQVMHQEDPRQHQPQQYQPQRQHQPQNQHHYRPKVPHQYQMEKGMVSRYRPNMNAPKRGHCICITISLLLLGIIALITWLAYRPAKPQFTVAGAAIYGINATTPPLISMSMQFNIIIKNPNKRVSIYVDRFSAVVSYRNQPITPHVALPPLYLEAHSTVSLSPVIGGSPVPVSVDVANGLEVDENYGVVGVKLVFLGRLKWKAGEIRSAHYGIYVKCNLLLALKKGSMGQVPVLGAPICEVDT